MNSLVEHSIPTKTQNKRNCAYKSTKVLWRYLASLQNPEMNFYLKEEGGLFLGNDEGKNPEQSGYVADERIIFKEIKAGLVGKAIQNLFELVRNFEDEKGKINPDLKIYLQNQIQKLFDEIEAHSEEKIAKILDEPSPDKKEIKIHQRIQNLVSPSFFNETPRDDLTQTSASQFDQNKKAKLSV